MKKNIIRFLIFMSFIFCINANAATVNDGVGTDLNKYSCTSKYQDNNYNITGSAYFSHCMRAQCSNNKYKIVYYTNSMPKCSNGNSSYYYKLYKNGCNTYENANSCTNNTEKYCSIIMYYDCSKKSDGSSFYTTTTTKKMVTTKKVTVPTTRTTEITTQVPITYDTSLSKLELSEGSITFNKDIYEYNISVDFTVKNIVIDAVATDSSNKIDIIGNDNIVNGSIINIVITAQDGTNSTYKINVNVNEKKLSNDARMKSLTIEGYDLSFDASINEYNLTIKENVKELNIDYETIDPTAVVLISDNSNLKNGSVIKIAVTAQDGTENDYFINIIVKKKSNILGVLFTIVIILALLVGAYYIYKKIMASKVGEKYEYE